VAPVVNDMELSSDGSSLTIAGLFSTAGGQARANLARLDTGTGIADPAWIADTDAAVDVLEQAPSGNLLAGGDFTSVNASGRNHLAMLDETDGSVLAWQPLIASLTGPGSVQALAVDDSSGQLYVGGSFADIGGDTAHNNITVFAMASPVTVSASSGGFASNSPPLTVTLTCTDNSGNSPCAATYYTLDGSTPKTASAIYAGPIMISGTTTLKFFSVDVDGNREVVHSEIYTIESAAPVTTAIPLVTVLNGINYEPVELACDDGAGGSGCATTYYTMDGSDPTPASMVYTAPIELTNPATTIKYFSIDQAGNSELPVKTSTYTLDMDLPTISISHPSGNYTPPLTVTILCDDGAGSGCSDIYINTDGSLPDVTTAEYHHDYSVSGPSIEITLNSASIVRVQASDIAGNVGNSIIGIYTFTQADALRRNSSGTGSLSWLPLLLLPLLWWRRLRSVPEMTHAGKDHGDIVFIGGVNDLLVPHRSPRLDHRRDAHLGGTVETIAKREEGV